MNADTLTNWAKALAATVYELRDEPTGVPEGIAYAGLMSQGCTHNDFSAITSALVHTGLVSRHQNHTLHWTGPTNL